jgi:competence protein ComGC
MFDTEVYLDTILYVKRIKRLTVAAASALVGVLIWTGVPLFALWVGSRFEGWISSRVAGNGVTMRAMFVVVLVLAVLELVMTFALTRLSTAYDDLTDRPPEARRTSPWLRSMRGEREEFARDRQGISVVERIVVLSVVAATLVLEYWFFFLAGSSLGNGGA